MAVNRDKPGRWKADVAQSVDMYNDWFMKFDAMPADTFSFRMNVPVRLEGGIKSVNIPIDAVIDPKGVNKRRFPVFFEARSAGDFTNTNKRRKEEAVKMSQLRSTYGKRV